ncbi:MAG: hypothetical protein ACP5PW_08435 [Candidatus Dormibacteria bacterium]
MPEEIVADGEEQVAWMMTPYHAPVLDREGSEFGTTASLLGDEASDIFHGLAVKPNSGHQLLEVEASHVVRITNRAVHTDLSPEEAAALPPYQQERWYHLGEGGLFRKRPEWRDG